jgi:phosphate transport system substrate-binding protein
LIAALALTAAVPAAAEARKTITMSGSTSVAPLATRLARKYVRVTDHRVGFKILQGGSDVGIADVAHGRVSIGNSSRDPKPGDPGGLVFNKISKDALCVVTNKSNPIPNLTQPQVKAIFQRNVVNWSGVPGSPRNDTINVFVRTPASGTQDAFNKLFLDGEKPWSGASQKASSGLVQQSVRSSGPGIGYVSLAFGAGIHTVAFNGVPCSLRNAKSGQYDGTRNFYMVTRGAPVGVVKRFLRWVRRSRAARRIISTEWVPLT